MQYWQNIFECFSITIIDLLQGALKSYFTVFLVLLIVALDLISEYRELLSMAETNRGAGIKVIVIKLLSSWIKMISENYGIFKLPSLCLSFNISGEGSEIFVHALINFTCYRFREAFVFKKGWLYSGLDLSVSFILLLIWI